MEDMPKHGSAVRFEDPWFYKGEGVVVQVQFQPHQAVLVDIKTMDDERHQNWVGRSVWVLPGHLTVV